MATVNVFKAGANPGTPQAVKYSGAVGGKLGRKGKKALAAKLLRERRGNSAIARRASAIGLPKSAQSAGDTPEVIAARSAALKTAWDARNSMAKTDMMQDLQVRAQGLHPDQINTRDARRQEDDKRRLDDQKSEMRNAVMFAEQVMGMEPKNGVYTFKDANALVGVIKGYNPYVKKLDPETGEATHVPKQISGEVVRGTKPDGSPGKAKMHLYTVDPMDDSVKIPVVNGSGNPVQWPMEQLSVLSRMGRKYATEMEMNSSISATREASKAVRQKRIDGKVARKHELQTAIIQYGKDGVPPDLMAEYNKLNADINVLEGQFASGNSSEGNAAANNTASNLQKVRGIAPDAATGQQPNELFVPDTAIDNSQGRPLSGHAGRVQAKRHQALAQQGPEPGSEYDEMISNRPQAIDVDEAGRPFDLQTGEYVDEQGGFVVGAPGYEGGAPVTEEEQYFNEQAV